MTNQYPSTTVDGSTGSGAEIVPNPPVNGVGDIIGTLYNNILLPVGTSILKARVDQEMAIGAAKAQAKINSYHVNDPSIGPNDPRAALAAESRTTAQKWLPGFMLAPAPAKADGQQTFVASISPVGWIMLIVAGFLTLGLIFRLFRK